MYQLLIVEDDHDLSEITRIHLEHAGYACDAAYTCAEARTRLAETGYDLILLDMLLPDSTGDRLCSDIRSSCQCPIIFMSCLDDSATIIGALGAGGDDYVTKPIKYDELLARVEANLRRRAYYREAANPEPHLRRYRQFTIDTARRRVLQNGQEIDLSSIEYALLSYMSEHPDTLLLYHDLYRHVWESDSLGDVRTVMVHISNLRKKIDPGRTGLIETVRGAGYIFSDI